MASFLKRIPAAKKFVDFRSDTVTRPTRAMREVMLDAPVGDDVMGDDPTINLLEQTVAEMLGKEAAIFVPTGTMGNVVSIAAHCQRGDEVIVGQEAHIFCHEYAASSLLGVGLCPLKNEADGTIDINEIKRWIRIDDVHCPRTALVALENSMALRGGKILPIDYINRVADLCHSRGIKLHIDGARLFNAVVGSGVSVKTMLENVDSVSFCLSKGLGAPVGSVVSGTADFIHRARRARKLLGGGMRQAGILAACGLYALENNIERLAEDHENAKTFAAAIRTIPELQLAPDDVQTNMFFFYVKSDKFTRETLLAKLSEKGFRLNWDETSDRIRVVTHLDVSATDVQNTIVALKETVAELSQ